jgi:hypothetical protein
VQASRLGKHDWVREFATGEILIIIGEWMQNYFMSEPHVDSSVQVVCGGRRPSQDGFDGNAAASDDEGRMPRFLPVEERFNDRHFKREIPVLCLRWYLSFNQFAAEQLRAERATMFTGNVAVVGLPGEHSEERFDAFTLVR